jgi:hypothetical protein
MATNDRSTNCFVIETDETYAFLDGFWFGVLRDFAGELLGDGSHLVLAQVPRIALFQLELQVLDVLVDVGEFCCKFRMTFLTKFDITPSQSTLRFHIFSSKKLIPHINYVNNLIFLNKHTLLFQSH